jgi:DNA-binding CsgD family transcriptional regulator
MNVLRDAHGCAAYEDVHALWDCLADHEASRIDEALRACLERLAGLTGASNAFWLGAVRDTSAPTNRFRGWRVEVVEPLYPCAAFDDMVHHCRHRLESGQPDRVLSQLIARVGRARVQCWIELTGAVWFESQRYRVGYLQRGVRDLMLGCVPVQDGVEALIGVTRSGNSQQFSVVERQHFAYALRGTKWFHRQLMLSHGIVGTNVRITPTERRIVKRLLGGQPEKLIALQLGLSYHGTHKHVSNIYRKYGISSRSELTALWLGPSQRA